MRSHSPKKRSRFRRILGEWSGNAIRFERFGSANWPAAVLARRGKVEAGYEHSRHRGGVDDAFSFHLRNALAHRACIVTKMACDEACRLTIELEAKGVEAALAVIEERERALLVTLEMGDGREHDVTKRAAKRKGITSNDVRFVRCFS